MITCERCKTENLDGSQYCDECGALLVPAGGAVRARKPDTGRTEDEGPAEGVTSAGLPAESSVTASEVRAASEARPAPARHDGGPVGRATSVSIPAPESAPSIESARRNGPHAKLVIHRGRSVGKEFPLNENEAQIGRWDADGGIFPDVDLDADDPEAKVSRRHARITRRGEEYFIEDLGSTNGTFINRGRRLLPGDRQPLHDGDEVIVGKTFLRFEVIK